MKVDRFTLLFVTSLLVLAPAWEAIADEQAKATAMRLGRMKAMSCAACHGMDGKGIERDGKWVAPGYADSEILKGDGRELALIILKGVQREDEDYTGAMAGMGEIYDDRSLAAVMTWVRNQWGGHDDVVTAEQAAAWRKEFEGVTGPVALSDIDE
jgi:mono/diheme cytochrome c family protein